MKGIFITGTDTNVGKTYIGCKIAAELTARNAHELIMNWYLKMQFAPGDLNRLYLQQKRPEKTINTFHSISYHRPVELIPLNMVFYLLKVPADFILPSVKMHSMQILPTQFIYHYCWSQKTGWDA